jgi:hypothetical protein
VLRKAGERCIVFMHLPKSGGTTLTRVLRWKYGSQLLVLERETQTTRMEEIAEAVPLSRRRSARVVAGHVHHGIHEFIPRECAYITLLREPVARVTSYFKFIMSEPRHWLHEQMVLSDTALEDLLETSPPAFACNEQTRFISGRGSDGRAPRSEYPHLDRDALEDAKRNLERFLVVGVQEEFDETFILIRRALGWRLPMYVTSRVTKGSGPMPSSAVDLIRERNQLDLELYEFARELFSAEVAEQGPSFRREVAAFKAMNAIPDRIGRHVPVGLRHRLRAALPR